MKPLPRPPHTAHDVYLTCIEGAQSPHDLRQYTDHVRICAEQFTDAARRAALHDLDLEAFRPAAEHARKALAKVYTNRMVKGVAGRRIYNELIAATRICPLCQVGRVATLDHHLPKSIFLYLSVAPDNLIPACSDCNTVKNDTAPALYEDQTLHPYFDDIGQDQWLTARIREQETPEVDFFILTQPGRCPGLTARVQRHFDVFGLADLYSLNAASELAGLVGELRDVYDEAGADAVQAHLVRRARSQRERMGRNAWQSACYQALADSSWYCDGGFDF